MVRPCTELSAGWRSRCVCFLSLAGANFRYSSQAKEWSSGTAQWAEGRPIRAGGRYHMATIEQAKQAAVAQFLSGGEQPVVSALAVSTKPVHNVTGIGRGPKIVEGKETGEEVLRFYVERKLPPPAVPGSDLLPAVYDGVPTDVIE